MQCILLDIELVHIIYNHVLYILDKKTREDNVFKLAI